MPRRNCPSIDVDLAAGEPEVADINLAKLTESLAVVTEVTWSITARKTS
jgi:hypothetical protein